MNFRNLTLYALPPLALSAAELEERLQERPLKPCTGLALQTLGWIATSPDGALVHASGDNWLITLGQEKKVLPPAVVRREVETRCAELEKQQGYKPGRKQRRDLNDKVMVELLPRAFAKPGALRAWIFPGWLVIDTASPGRAEMLVTALREVMTGTLKAVPMSPGDDAMSMEHMLTLWLDPAGGPPDGFDLGDESEMVGLDLEKPTVRYTHHDLVGADIKQHLKAGKRVKRLALIWKQRISLVLDASMVARKVTFLEVDNRSQPGDEVTPEDAFEAEVALFTGEMRKLLADLARATKAKTGLDAEQPA